MLAFRNTGLDTELCMNCNCSTFVPTVAFTYVAATPQMTFTQSSTIPSGDTFGKVVVHVYDRAGHSVHGVITTAGGNTGALSLTGFDLSSIDVIATVSTLLGCSGDASRYDIQTGTTSGSLNVS